MGNFTSKEQKYINAYVGEADMCQTMAARIAGYSDPRQDGWRVYSNPEVKAAIAKILKERQMAKEDVQEKIEKLAKGLPDSCFKYNEETNELELDLKAIKENGFCHLIESITYDRRGKQVIKFKSQDSYMNLLSKINKLYDDQQIINNTPVKITLLDDIRNQTEQTEQKENNTD